MSLRKPWMRLLGLILIGLLAFQLVGFAKAKRHAAVVLSIRGGIGPAVEDFVQRGIKQANKQNAAVIVLQIDTPGGLDTSMRGIIKSMLASNIPVLAYVAPSGARAASAGTYILYAAQIAAMAPGTNLGAATPISLDGSGSLPKEKQEKQHDANNDAEKQKVLNDARAYIRSLAALRGRNVAWAEKAVTRAESLSAPEALQQNVINFVAQDVPDLLNKVDGLSVGVNGQQVKLSTKGLRIIELQADWRSRLLTVITDPSVAYILLMIGVYGVFFEFFNPGFVAPGVIGAISLLVGLYALALLPINYAGLALILLGLAFIIAEAFVPSFGVLGIGGVVSFIFGSIFLLKVEYMGPRLPLYLIIITALVTTAFLIFILSMVSRARKRPVVTGGEALIGKKAILQIDEEGKYWIQISGESWQCRSDKSIDAGQLVVVKKIDGLMLVVRCG